MHGWRGPRRISRLPQRWVRVGPAGRWAGFRLVWVALVIFTSEAITYRRRQMRLAVEASAV